MSVDIKIDGIYDRRTLDFLKKTPVRHYGFDFRPTSFSFIQQYKFLELLGEGPLPERIYYMHFAGEKDFIIRQFLQDLKNVWGHLDTSRFKLEFSGKESIEFCEQFRQKYYYHFSFDQDCGELVSSKNMEGLVLRYSDLQMLAEENKLYKFTQEFYNYLAPLFRFNNFKLVLEVGWNNRRNKDIFEFFDFDLLNLPLNHEVEICYRNIDLNRLDTGLKNYQNFSSV